MEPVISIPLANTFVAFAMVGGSGAERPTADNQRFAAPRVLSAGEQGGAAVRGRGKSGPLETKRFSAARSRFYAAAAMTRPQIELCIKIFIVLLIIAFAGAVTHVFRELGLA